MTVTMGREPRGESMTQLNSRFEKSEFEEASRIGEASVLSRALEDEVRALVMKAMADEMSLIVAELNKLGHHLVLFETPTRDNIAFRDDGVISGIYTCNLNVACDVVISSGFRDTVSIESLDDSA